MAVELLLPGRRISAPKPPSYLALDMAFGVGNLAILGDKSRYRGHGTITGAVPAAGVHGYCLDFNPAIPGRVAIPAAHTHLNFTSEDFSIIARVNVDDLTGTRHVYNRGLTTVGGYDFYIEPTGQIRGRTIQVAAAQVTVSAVGEVVIGNWYTLGLSRVGASIRLYKNGVDVTTVPAVHIDPTTCVRVAYIGIYGDVATNPWDGKIEFLRIFRGIALQTSEHLAWHNALA